MSVAPVTFAEEVGRTIADGVQRWVEDGEEAQVFWVHGPPGAGKTDLLQWLAAELPRRSIPVLHAAPPELDLDAPIHLNLQLASGLRRLGANGALEVMVDRQVTEAEKDRTLLEEISVLDRCVLLLDRPFSWVGSARDSSDLLAVGRRGNDLLKNLIVRAVADGKAVVIVTRGQWRWPEEVQIRPKNVLLASGSKGPAFLEDEPAWGPIAGYAKKLLAKLGDLASERSALELRVAVALIAMSYNMDEVRRACRGGLRSLLTLLGQELSRRPDLSRAYAALMQIRFPVVDTVVKLLVEPHLPQGKADLERLVIEHALLLRQSGGYLLHPSLRELSGQEQALDFDRLVHAHAVLADAFARSAPLTPRLDAHRDIAIAQLEEAYHAGRALRTDTVRTKAVDAAQICNLARTLSIHGQKNEALALYEDVLERDASHRYARAYVAFHLEHLGREPLRAERLFRESWEDEKTNPWWARRYICCLIRRGRVRDARVVWLDALSDLEDPEADRDEWLARNFHLGVANHLLLRGALAEAREVLTHISPSIRTSNAELSDMWNQLLHMEESERLGGAVFPMIIPFERRWSGPHLMPDQRDAPPLDAWYPGRIVDLGDAVTLELAESPLDGAEPRLFRSQLSREEFLRCARRTSLELITQGQFLEVAIRGDDTRIELHPVRRRGLRISAGFLRNLEELA